LELEKRLDVRVDGAAIDGGEEGPDTGEEGIDKGLEYRAFWQVGERGDEGHVELLAMGHAMLEEGGGEIEAVAGKK
jgi:hypothetical protein